MPPNHLIHQHPIGDWGVPILPIINSPSKSLGQNWHIYVSSLISLCEAEQECPKADRFR